MNQELEQTLFDNMKYILMASGFKTNDINYNKNKILEAIYMIAQKDDFLLFGESFLQGFDALSWNYETDQHIAIEQSNVVIQEIQEVCSKKQVNVSFGYFEKENESIYSSQITIGQDGNILDNYRRISKGWKIKEADSHYVEGDKFHTFKFNNENIAVGLCGDLWDEENIEQMKKLKPSLVLWPVYTDFDVQEWNTSIIYEYAEQASKLDTLVGCVNSVCLDESEEILAKGGASWFKNNEILARTNAGEETYCSLEI